MLAKLSPRAIHNLARLSTDEFKPLREQMETELQAVYKGLAKADSANVLTRLQGRAQVIQELLELIEKAPEMIG